MVQLRKTGLSVYSIADEQPSIKDENVLNIAFEANALLLTEDKDFGELIFRLRLPHHGILLIRIETPEFKISAVVETVFRHYTEILDKFSVINDTKLRIKE